MNRELVKPILILPGTALVYVPGALVWLTAGLPGGWALAGATDPRFRIGVALAVPGFALAVWTVRLFVTAGEDTPAPWAPPRKLVVRGPYRHVRNPMLSAVNVMLTAEALLFGSWYVAGWMAVFVVLNTVYFFRKEEPALERRFGESYRSTRRTCRAGYRDGGGGMARDGAQRLTADCYSYTCNDTNVIRAARRVGRCEERGEPAQARLRSRRGCGSLQRSDSHRHR